MKLCCVTFNCLKVDSDRGSLSSLHRNSISSAMKWLWRRSAPSDWLRAEDLFSEPPLTPPVLPNATRGNTRRKELLRVDPTPTCEHECVCVCVCVSVTPPPPPTCVRGHACIFECVRVFIYMCVCARDTPPTHTHTHTNNLYRRWKKKRQTHTHSGDFSCVCVCVSDTGDFTCLYKEKRKNDMLKKKTKIRC